MPKRLKRAFWLACLTALLAAGLLVACWRLPLLIPPEWNAAAPVTRPVDDDMPYLVPGSLTENKFLSCDATFTPQGEGVYASTLVTVRLADVPNRRLRINRSSTGGTRTRNSLTDLGFPEVFDYGNRDHAISTFRDSFRVTCISAGYPEAATLFDQIIASPTSSVTLHYPGRARAAFLMSLRPYALVASACALAIALPFAARTLYQAAIHKRGIPLCSTCGYQLAGLPGNTPCPECGAPKLST